jgi:hypothetical protein
MSINGGSCYCVGVECHHTDTTEETLQYPRLKIIFFWDTTPCCLVISYGRFGETCYFGLHGNARKVSCVSEIVSLHFLGRVRISRLVKDQYEYWCCVTLKMEAVSCLQISVIDYQSTSIIHSFIRSFYSLSYDRSTISSKASSSQDAI